MRATAPRPPKDLDHYLNTNMVFLFDTAGFAGAISSVQDRAGGDPGRRIVIAPTIRRRSASANRCAISCATCAPADGETILRHVGKLLKAV